MTKKKPKRDLRSIKFTIMVSPDEKWILERLAAKLQRTVSDAIRVTAINEYWRLEAKDNPDEPQ